MKCSAKTIGRAVVVIAVVFVAQSAMARDGLWRKAMETAERILEEIQKYMAALQVQD